MTDVQFGVDLSHHKPNFNFNAAVRDGVVFAILKATDGASLVDPLFAPYLAAAKAAGLFVAAYHYQQAAVSAAAQVALILRTVPADVPLIVDVERGSGSAALTRDIVAGLTAVGRRVILTYLPKWYWQQIGSPSLVGLPPLWSSRYPDNRVGTLDGEYADIAPSYWDGYGGLPVAVLQFSSSVGVANYPVGSIDGSAFRGTRAQLAAFFGGLEIAPQEVSTDMSGIQLYPATDTTKPGRGVKALPGPSADPGTRCYVTTGWGNEVSLTVWFLGEGGGYLGAAGGAGYSTKVRSDKPSWFPVPAGAIAVHAQWTTTKDIPGDLEIKYVPQA